MAIMFAWGVPNPAADIEVREGDELQITEDRVLNMTTGKAFDQMKLPAARKSIMDVGGLIPYTRKLLMARAQG